MAGGKQSETRGSQALKTPSQSMPSQNKLPSLGPTGQGVPSLGPGTTPWASHHAFNLWPSGKTQDLNYSTHLIMLLHQQTLKMKL